MQNTCSIKTTLVYLAWGKNIPLLISVKSSYNRNLTVKEKRKSVVDHVSTSASYKKPNFPICRLFSWKITLSIDQDQAIQLIGVQQKISAAELEFFVEFDPNDNTCKQQQNPQIKVYLQRMASSVACNFHP